MTVGKSLDLSEPVTLKAGFSLAGLAAEPADAAEELDPGALTDVSTPTEVNKTPCMSDRLERWAHSEERGSRCD